MWHFLSTCVKACVKIFAMVFFTTVVLGLLITGTGLIKM